MWHWNTALLLLSDHERTQHTSTAQRILSLILRWDLTGKTVCALFNCFGMVLFWSLKEFISPSCGIWPGLRCTSSRCSDGARACAVKIQAGSRCAVIRIINSASVVSIRMIYLCLDDSGDSFYLVRAIIWMFCTHGCTDARLFHS